MSGPDWDEAKCIGSGDTFYTPEVDAREEVNRDIRENMCRAICFTCDLRIPCLMMAAINQEVHGVWGGMTESERRRFFYHLQRSRWQKTRTELSFRAAVRSFYKLEDEEYVTVGYRSASARRA